MPRIKKEHETTEDGWSRWVPPLMDGYRMACCDCGLVHDMQFQAVRVDERDPDGTWYGEDLDVDEYRVLFRARRNPRSTGQVRRHMKADNGD